MNEQEKQQLNELLQWKKDMEFSSTIPVKTFQALNARLGSSGTVITTSAKSASSENRVVDEGGSATYSVMKTPDAFLQTTINGQTYYIPIFT